MVMNVLHLASEESANFDLRDRGYIYWRMLSQVTNDVVLIKRPEYIENLEQMLDDETLEIFTTDVITKNKKKQDTKGEVEESKGDEDGAEQNASDEVEEQEVEEEPKPKAKSKKSKNKKKSSKSKKKDSDEEKEENVEVEEKIDISSKPGGDFVDLLGIDFS
mmetsp:Transcript_17053/g.19666  ORF Transcript_17053/g.19666 Transcript_17053/m.19666 type:complete len:162 (-) Transcript_17053:46-531(-)